MTKKVFNFPKKNGLPFFFVSAADGTNVVQVFKEAVKSAVAFKSGSKDFVAEVLELLDDVSCCARVFVPLVLCVVRGLCCRGCSSPDRRADALCRRLHVASTGHTGHRRRHHIVRDIEAVAHGGTLFKNDAREHRKRQYTRPETAECDLADAT